MDRETELTLVARLRAGDADAFDAVHTAFNRRLFTFLLRLWIVLPRCQTPNRPRYAPIASGHSPADA